MTTAPKKSAPDASSIPSMSEPSDFSVLEAFEPIEVERKSEIDAAIDHYRAEIATLQAASYPSAEQLLDARIARDALHTLELELPRQPNSALVQQIKQLDRQFKREIERFKAAYKKQALKRHAQDPNAKWWWFPDPPVPKPFWSHLDSVWSASSLVFLTFSGGLIADLAGRVLTGGLDVWGSSTVIIQGLVTLIVGKSALTTSGQETVKQWLGQRGFSRRWWDEGSLVVSMGLFALLLGFQSFVLPEFSKFYKCLGDADYAQVDGLPTCLPGGEQSRLRLQGLESISKGKVPRLLSAETMYKRALSLNPDYVDAHFALGMLYEELQNGNRAQDAYEKAVKGGKLEAYNRLSQLALNQEKPDYEKAVAWLRKGLVKAYKTEKHELLYEMVDTLTHLAVNDPASTSKSNLVDKEEKQDKEEREGKYLNEAVFWLSRGLDVLNGVPDNFWQYRLKRNLGWVLFRQGESATALDHLQAAIALDPLQADAYCLRAQVYQQQLPSVRQPKTPASVSTLQQNVVEDWERCRSLASPYTPYGEVVDPNKLLWQREATKQLKKYSIQKPNLLKYYAQEQQNHEA